MKEEKIIGGNICIQPSQRRKRKRTAELYGDGVITQYESYDLMRFKSERRKKMKKRFILSR